MKKKMKKKKQEEIDVNVNKNITTPTLPTTRIYIKSWGYFDLERKIIIEQINPNFFIYNSKGKKEIIQVEPVFESSPNPQTGKLKIIPVGNGFVIDDVVYLFKGRIQDVSKFYNVPDYFKVKAYVEGKIKPRPFKELYTDINKAINELFDFTNPTDSQITDIHIAQSWVKPLRNEAFFYGVDATKGGGKTTLGEIVYFLMRHGFVGGNISSASMVRLVDDLDLNIFIDELDQKAQDEDLMGIMRQGQRRDNCYVRCEGRDNHPVAYNSFGCHGFSYRSDVEDAFLDRSLRVHTEKSMDYRLPTINSIKKEVLKALADELFLWFIDQILVVGSSRERTCSKVLTPKQFNRNSLYFDLISKFSDVERELLKRLFGRDNELAYLSLETTKLLGIDAVKDISEMMDKKKDDALTSQNLYDEAVIEYIHRHKVDILGKTLKDGLHAGMPFYPKSLLYQGFIKHLKELNVQLIGTKRFSSLIRDLGFTEGDTLTSQRYGNYPSACLIFSDKVKKKLGLLEDKPIITPIPKEQVPIVDNTDYGLDNNVDEDYLK